MSDFEDLIRLHALRSPDEIVCIPIMEYLKAYTFEPISQGTFFRVYKVVGHPWVMKEGRWDVHLNIHDRIQVPIHPELSGILSKRFSSEIFPTYDEIKRQYKDYLQFVEYFGYFERSEDSFYDHHSQILLNQKSIRDSLVDLLPLIESEYRIKISKKILAILDSETRYYNFLPKEYCVVAPSISPENKGRDTVFIFQEFVAGTRLHDLKRKRMTYHQKAQLILLVYLILVMHYQIGLIPDTRPRYPVLELFGWLPKTDNIIIGADGVRFVDTRWFWETQANFIKRGAVIPELSLSATKNYLNWLLSSF
jgi:hypothetical protein